MWLEEKDKAEADKVLLALGVEPERLKFISCCYEGGWMHRFEHYLGNGWSGVCIDRGPDWEDPELVEEADESDFITVDGVQYFICETD